MAKRIDSTIISVLGCGWYGMELAKELVRMGYPVKGSTTTEHKKPLLEAAGIKAYLLNFDVEADVNEQDFFDSDILIICIPPKRNSAHLSLYGEKIFKIAVSAESSSISNILFISASSIYSDTNQIIDEQSPANPGTASGIQILKAEQLLKKNLAFTTTVLRFSGLVGPGRHPGRFFSGKKNIPNGKAPINLVHLDDCIQLTLKIIVDGLFGKTYNVSSPDHPEKQHFYKIAAQNLRLETPEFIDELKEWKIISSINVPNFVQYDYKIKDWMKWLDDNIN